MLPKTTQSPAPITSSIKTFIAIALTVPALFLSACATGTSVISVPGADKTIIASSPRGYVEPVHATGGALHAASGIMNVLSLNPINVAMGLFDLLGSSVAFDNAVNKKTIIQPQTDDTAEPAVEINKAVADAEAAKTAPAATVIEAIEKKAEETIIPSRATENEQTRAEITSARVLAVPAAAASGSGSRQAIIEQNLLSEKHNVSPNPEQLGVLQTDMQIERQLFRNSEALLDRLKSIKPEKRELGGSSVIETLPLKKNSNKKNVAKAAELFAKALNASNGKQYSEAIKHYSACLVLLKDNPVVYFNRGVAYQLSMQYKQAFADYTKAIEIAPDTADAYYNRGIVNHLIGSSMAAIKDYDNAIRLNKNDADAYWNRGFVYADMGIVQTAATNYCKAIDVENNKIVKKRR